jgi:hypothetical protein
MKFCLCGEEAERFKVFEPTAVNPADVGVHLFFGVSGIVGGEACCSAFTAYRYQLTTREKAQAIVDDYNEREHVHLGADAVEVQPCQIVAVTEADGETMEPCDEHAPDIACWTVYWHLARGGVMWIEDFTKRADAEMAAGFLSAMLQVPATTSDCPI